MDSKDNRKDKSVSAIFINKRCTFIIQCCDSLVSDPKVSWTAFVHSTSTLTHLGLGVQQKLCTFVESAFLHYCQPFSMIFQYLTALAFVTFISDCFNPTDSSRYYVLWAIIVAKYDP